MRRPNKKKVEGVEVVEEAPTEETPQPVRALDRINCDARRKLPLKPPRPAQILTRSYEAELELAEAEVTCGHLTTTGYEILWRAAQLEQSALWAKIGLLERQCRLRKLDCVAVGGCSTTVYVSF